MHDPPVHTVPSLEDIMLAEEHEVSVRRRNARRKRAVDSASKMRHSRRLAAKEEPFYMSAVNKATKIKAKKMGVDGAWEELKKALAQSAILERPPTSRISAAKLKCLGRACGLGHLSEVEDEEVPEVA